MERTMTPEPKYLAKLRDSNQNVARIRVEKISLKDGFGNMKPA
jgi:hypothetical protein